MIEFLATIADSPSAIKVGTDGMRILLDVPESELPNAITILNCRGKVIKVKVELEKHE